MSISALENAIRSRIIIELLSPGEYSGIWLFDRPNTGIWLFIPGEYWNLVIHRANTGISLFPRANTGIWLFTRANILESEYSPGI